MKVELEVFYLFIYFILSICGDCLLMARVGGQGWDGMAGSGDIQYYGKIPSGIVDCVGC